MKAHITYTDKNAVATFFSQSKENTMIKNGITLTGHRNTIKKTLAECDIPYVESKGE